MRFILSLAEGSVASLYPCNLLCVILSTIQHDVFEMLLRLQGGSLTMLFRLALASALQRRLCLLQQTVRGLT